MPARTLGKCELIDQYSECAHLFSPRLETYISGYEKAHRKRKWISMRQLVFATSLIAIFTLAGCVEWTRDPAGNVRSVGVPGVPLWESKAPPAPMTATAMGMSPEEAAKMSGPVLVMPPDPPTHKDYRYRFYQTGQNRCEEELKAYLYTRSQTGETGPAPYCTTTPPAPAETQKGGFLLF